MKPLPKNYDHKEAEPRWQQRWEEDKVYAWDAQQPRENTFVIDTPPPTVSGILHMGHIFSYTQADFVARFQRMSGKTVFYPMGFDDNGLPTERLVEKIKGKKASQYPSREAFIADCKEVVKSAEDNFRKLFKSTALSVDWSQEYQTVSDDVRKLSQLSFLDLLKKGEAYRDFRPTYWDWVDQTAIAQAEIENKEMPGVMNTLLFTLEDDTPLHIATTRPELLGACVAVMYHPEDPNAEMYRGQTAITPVFEVRVPMIADELVERDKGTGLVMCCTFGDDTDKEWQRKHALPVRPILGEDGKIKVDAALGQSGITFFKGSDDSAIHEGVSADIIKTIEVFKHIEGLKPKQANAKMLEMLDKEGALLKQDNITHSVKCAERSGTPIEIIPTYQWFVKVTDKKEALKAKGAECKWYPEFMHIRLNQWIDGLKEDWCISRQRFFGVPFPVWYVRRADDENTTVVYATEDQLPADPLNQLPAGMVPISGTQIGDQTNHATRCILTKDILNRDGNVLLQGDGHTHYLVTPDKDVMDTWATSSVSPQISAHGISGDQCADKERFGKLFPADIRPQAHEIIRTWAFYTIVKAHLHTDTVPWNNLMISGWCLASDKTKMSKSKGNVVTPVDLILEKGADVVRYWASTSRLGADTAFSEDLLKIGKKLVTKLWNATAFAAIHLTKIQAAPATAAQAVTDGKITEVLDKWILSRLNKTVTKASQEFARFEYCDARVAVEEFFWKDFCDNYLELVKARAYGEIGDAKAQASAHLTLYYCLNTLLRLFAPFMPHITEELYSHLFEGKGSVHARGNWPSAADYPVDEEAEASGIVCINVLEVLRKAKSIKNVSIKSPIKKLVMHIQSPQLDWAKIKPFIFDLKAAGNIEEVDYAEDLHFDSLTAEWHYFPSKHFALDITFDEQADVA